MASKCIGNSSTAQRTFQMKRVFYFHIRGGIHLNITRADIDPLWKDVPEVTSATNVYHTIQCAKMTTLQSGRSFNAEDNRRLKEKLQEFVTKAETLQMSQSLRYEARFGHLFVYPEDQIPKNPVTKHLLTGSAFRRQFVTRLLYYDIEAFKQNHCELIVNPNVTTYKIRFIQYGEDLDKGEFSGVCYIEERAGKFTLLGVHNGNERVNELKIDIIRPGGMYDIRIVTGVHNYDEEKVPDCVKAVAEKITTSLIRSSNNLKEIRLQVVGENFEVDYIREKKTNEYKWKTNPQWIFVEHDIQQLHYKKENCQTLKTNRKFCPVPITFTQSDCRKEVELWSKVHSQPDGTSHWTTEQMLAGFDEFVGTCFDIAGFLADVPVPAISTD